MMISTPALWVALAAMIPLMLAAAIQDLRELKISNYIVLGVVGVFIVTGLWGLPTEIFLWRFGQGVVMLIIGFLVFTTGVVGGADAKMAAALAPFIVPEDVVAVVVLYAITTFVMLMVLRLVMALNRHEATGWRAIDQQTEPAMKRKFPMGLIFGVTIVIYLGIYATEGLF